MLQKRVFPSPAFRANWLQLKVGNDALKIGNEWMIFTGQSSKIIYLNRVLPKCHTWTTENVSIYNSYVCSGGELQMFCYSPLFKNV